MMNTGKYYKPGESCHLTKEGKNLDKLFKKTLDKLQKYKKD